MDVDYVLSRDLIQLLQPSTYLVLQLLNDSHRTSFISRDNKCCESCGKKYPDYGGGFHGAPFPENIFWLNYPYSKHDSMKYHLNKGFILTSYQTE